MGEEFGTRPDDIYAAIGPSIGPCCYEVGEEVAAKFGIPGSGHVHLDLRAINAGQLTDAGVPARNVSTSPACTKCESDLYHSFRRDREAAGRMISWIRIKPTIKPRIKPE
jgi:copper oxidase (laccase) domain-containing protein